MSLGLALTLSGELTFPATATADFFADRSGFSELPTWTGEQRLFRNPPGLRHGIETAETAGLVG